MPKRSVINFTLASALVLSSYNIAVAVDYTDLKQANQASGERTFTLPDGAGGISTHTLVNNLGTTPTGTLNIHGYNTNAAQSVVDADGKSMISNGAAITLNLNIENVTIQNAAATNGSVINSSNMNAGSNTNITINNALIHDNIASGTGGVIYNRTNGSLMNITNSAFSDNTSTASSGGAVYAYLRQSSVVNMSNSAFSGNSSGQNGGGAFYDIGNTSSITVDNVAFTGNEAKANGGGLSVILSDSSTATLSNLEVTSNSVSDTHGAGIYANATGNSSITIENIGFTSNKINPNDLPSTGGAGGGLYVNVDNGSTSTVRNLDFTDNESVTAGGGMFAVASNNSTMTITGVNFSGNETKTSSGGGMSTSVSQNSSMSISNADFSGNTSHTFGGAMINTVNTNSTLTITDSSFSNNNSTANRGGALHNTTDAGSAINIVASNGKTVSFTNNSDSSGANDFYHNPNTNVNLTGAGTIYMDGGIAGRGNVNKDQGTLVFAQRAVNSGFIGTYTQTGGTLTNYSTSFFGGTNSISNSNLNLLQVATLNIGNLAINNVNTSTINGLTSATNVTNFNATGTNNFAVDIDGAAGVSDVFRFTNAAGTGILNVDTFNLITAPVLETVDLTVFTGNISGYTFTSSESEVTTPIYKYHVKSLQSEGLSGQYRLFRTNNTNSINPQIFRGQVATLAAYQNQLVVNNVLFDHVYLDSNELVAKNQMNNRYAAAYPQFAPYQFVSEGGSIWFKTYATFERLSMTQGLNVNNNAYGTIVGADFDTINLGDGWKFLPTAFIAYNGGHQTYNGVSNYQNGGQGGFMGTFSKGDYIGSILAYGGGYNNEMSVGGFNDNVGNWFAGAAIKQAYNFHPTKNFIIQPNALVSYNIFGKQNWATDFGALSMNSGLLNGINVAPGINLIYGRETWSVYFTAMYMYNINDNVNGSAGPVNLPSVSMRHGYIEYGIGATKTWKERLMGYCQFVIRNGGRLGIGLQAGLSWKF